jgi:DNA polymerase-3 subunit delta
MGPAEFLNRLARQGPPAVCLFLGAEAYQRDRCRRALVEKFLPPDLRETGLVRHDLEEVTLAQVVDDACSLSLFAPQRLIWVSSAEVLLPRAGKRGQEEPDAGLALLERYAARPVPGVVLVLEASRFDYEGEGKKKLDRLAELLSFLGDPVVFARLSPAEAQRLAADLAREAGLRLTAAQLALLVEATGGEAVRIAAEIEKLSLWAGRGGQITEETISRLVPNAQAATIFTLVSALGRADRRKALELLDALVREGEYLPLALAFLGTQFRQALVAKEAGLRSPQQIQSYFARLGAPMWPSRAREVYETATLFSRERLEEALRKTHEADKALRDARPDDRTVLEEFVLAITR